MPLRRAERPLTLGVSLSTEKLRNEAGHCRGLQTGLVTGAPPLRFVVPVWTRAFRNTIVIC